MNYQDPKPPSLSTATVQELPVSRARLTRAMVIGGLVMVVVVGLLVGFDLFRKQMMKQFFAANVPPPVSVSYETVQPRSVARNLTAIGSIAAVHQVTISPEAAGTVTELSFLAGQPVKKGDVIAQLNDATERAELANYRAQQTLAAATLKRSRDLAGNRVASQASLDQAQSQYDMAAAGIARTQALIAQKRVVAPFDGTLGVRLTEVGKYLDRGGPIVQLTDMNELFVEFTLPEQARPQLRLGQPLKLTVDAYPGRTFTALLAVIDPQVNTATRTIKMQAVSNNLDGALMPGMFATINVELPTQDGVLTVPETALSYSLYGNAVFVVEGSGGSLTAKRTAVETGDTVDGRVVVTKGINAGDRIVTTGLGKLFDGAALLLSETPTLVQPEQIPRP